MRLANLRGHLSARRARKYGRRRLSYRAGLGSQRDMSNSPFSVGGQADLDRASATAGARTALQRQIRVPGIGGKIRGERQYLGRVECRGGSHG